MNTKSLQSLFFCFLLVLASAFVSDTAIGDEDKPEETTEAQTESAPKQEETLL